MSSTISANEISPPTERNQRGTAIRSLKEISQELHNSDPALVGIVAYGSLIRGRFDYERSDIDGAVFFDVDKHNANSKDKITAKTGTRYKYNIHGNSTDWVYTSFVELPQYIVEQVQSRVRLLIEQKNIVKRTDDLKDLRVIAISKDILDFEIQELNENQHINYKNVSYPNTTYGTVAVDALKFLFFPKVQSEDLDAYRYYVLKQLAGMGEDGRRIWAEIASTRNIFLGNILPLSLDLNVAMQKFGVE